MLLLFFLSPCPQGVGARPSKAEQPKRHFVPIKIPPPTNQSSSNKSKIDIYERKLVYQFKIRSESNIHCESKIRDKAKIFPAAEHGRAFKNAVV